jgi:hypothetical protein
MILKLLPFLLSGILIIGCAANSDSESEVEKERSAENKREAAQIKGVGTIKDRVYHSDEVGWTVTIPEGWKIASLSESQANTADGIDVLEDYLETDIDLSGLIELVSFSKSEFNDFAGTAEAFDEAVDGNYQDHNKQLQAIIYDASVEQGLTIDSSSTTAIIDGLSFNVFNMTIMVPDTDEEWVSLQMYSRYISKYDFAVSITSDNAADKKELTDAIMNSKFDIR